MLLSLHLHSRSMFQRNVHMKMNFNKTFQVHNNQVKTVRKAFQPRDTVTK